MLSTKSKLRLVYLGVSVYAAGYLVLLAAAFIGQIGGLVGFAAIVMATGLMIVVIFGALLVTYEARFVGEL